MANNLFSNSVSTVSPSCAAAYTIFSNRFDTNVNLITNHSDFASPFAALPLACPLALASILNRISLASSNDNGGFCIANTLCRLKQKKRSELRNSEQRVISPERCGASNTYFW